MMVLVKISYFPGVYNNYLSFNKLSLYSYTKKQPLAEGNCNNTTVLVFYCFFASLSMVNPYKRPYLIHNGSIFELPLRHQISRFKHPGYGENGPVVFDHHHE